MLKPHGRSIVIHSSELNSEVLKHHDTERKIGVWENGNIRKKARRGQTTEKNKSIKISSHFSMNTYKHESSKKYIWKNTITLINICPSQRKI